ncbi:MAG TPA: hypothetical protein VNT01_11665 [Symbiobacteriaceae bacterium]|nr:hypothetical protein [Symbiobacteriaceae bacterium]
MNEPFDVEISRALKESAARSLEGWEFTPAMRAKVMDRIRTEAADDTALASPPARRFDAARVIRPLAWVAVAAAAMVIAINTDLAGFGGSRKETASAPQVASKSAAPAPAPAAPPTPETVTAAQTKDGPVPAASSEQPAATAKSMAPESGARSADSTVAALTVGRSLAFELTLPGGEAQAEVAQALVAPPGANGKLAFTTMAPTNIAGAVSGNGSILTLTPFGVKAVDFEMVTVWERPLADLSHQSLLAVAPDGRAAVANGGDLLYLVNERGELDQTIKAGGAISQVLWSNDGRMAAAVGPKVVVYSAGTSKPQFTADAGEAAFAPDGVLAVYGGRSDDARLLTLIDPKGAVIARAQPAVAGRGLAVTGGGQVIVAGGQAYDRAGNALWQLPLKTDGIAPAGSDRLVAWDAHTVMLAGSSDGLPVWKANWNGAGPGIARVVPSPDGRFVAIVAPQADGTAVLWIVGSDGRQILTEKLAQMPVDLSVAGNQVVLILPDTVQYRSLPE